MTKAADSWDNYARFYDWENGRTMGRRDVPFWTRLARRSRGSVLELGCGTGRVSLPLAKAGVDLVGIDRSAAMLQRAARGFIRVRGDIRALPFGDGAFEMVIAPYGVLQSLVQPRDLAATLASVARVIARGGTFGLELMPDVPKWKEYRNRVQLRGRAGSSHVTLIESVRQDRRRRLTTFEQCYVERRGARAREHRFELTFRTVTVPEMSRQLERVGFAVASRYGDYNGGRWRADADTWIILARRGR